MSDLLNMLGETSRRLLFDAKFGLEKEHVRVTESGALAQTPHPAIFGGKLENPYITVDFAESQLEMITPPVGSASEAVGFLETIHDVVVENLESELLWPQSMPPELPDDPEAIQVAQFDAAGESLGEYREFLANAYGKKRQMISGVHVNMSISEVLMQSLYRDLAEDGEEFEAFRERMYMRSLRAMLKERWMVLLLLGMSPVMHKSYAEVCGDYPDIDEVTCGNSRSVSIRASLCGYRNKEEFQLDYSDLESFEQSVENLVEQGKLHSSKELYSPVRLKRSPETGRVSHLEFRLLDLDPTVKVGVREASLHLLHTWMLKGMLSSAGAELNLEQQERAASNQYACACCGLAGGLTDSNGKPMSEGAGRREVENLLAELRVVAGLGETQGACYQGSLQMYEEWLAAVRHPVREELRDASKNLGFLEYHLQLAQAYREDVLANSFGFKGMEGVELSTQLLLREGLKRGVKFEWLDRSENFVKLSKGEHVEYVQQATKTSRDKYSSILMMENKVVTKKVLGDAGIQVPGGASYTTCEEALLAYGGYKGRPLVVKPKTTNFGIGITIYPEGASLAQYKEALELAFAADREVLVEHFVAGREFRLFVIDGKVEGVLHRVPANVEGDGESNIRSLVEQKNQDPLRGVGYVRPLEKIATGREEALFLQQQGLDFDFVPALGQKVYLRENSNISTGGDSLDYTDELHPSYKDLAVRACEAMDVAVSGVDMMIADIEAVATDQNYSIIEMNFNPAIHIHCHPYQGSNRQLDSRLLDFLGF